MENIIEKRISLEAPVSRVWRALTDHKQFGEWFRVNLEQPFIPGQPTRGQLTYPGYEHVTMQVVTQKLEPESLFSFTWHPNAVDPLIDYFLEEPTLVEFKLEATATGTLLTVIESGFEKIPEHRRFEAFRRNDNGWAQQLKHIETYVAKAQ